MRRSHERRYKGGVSGQNVFYHVSVDIREPESASLVQVSESLVIDAEQVKNGRLQIMNVDGAG